MSMANSSQPSSIRYAYPPVAPGVLSSRPAQPVAGRPSMLSFDRFQRLQTVPIIRLTMWDQAAIILLHPMRYLSFRKQPPIAGEGLFETLYMYNKLSSALDPAGRKHLQKLQAQDVLRNTRSDDNHSTLFHLFAMLTTPRTNGFKPNILLKEAVEILNQPFSINQKFGPLSDNAAKKILQARNYPGSILQSGSQSSPLAKPLQKEDLNVENSATCVASSVMYYMADKEPSELARHLNELTSPMNAFLEKARLNEIAPGNPAQALQTLRDHSIPFTPLVTPLASDEVNVKVALPRAGVLRAVDSQKYPQGAPYRSALETAYQSALTALATSSYDPATDMRDSEPPEENGKGLTEEEKTLMETIVKENGGVQSVTFQAVANKSSPKPGEEGNSYLYGYYHSFEQTANYICQSLQMGQPVIIGTTDTDASGSIVTGHEITITGAFTDPKTKELQFIVADSDDDKPAAIVKSAKALIPTIHHAGFPLPLAAQIKQGNPTNSGYLIPDQNDAQNFKLLNRETGQMPLAEHTGHAA